MQYCCFTGKYGGGIPKAFRFTEIQKHRFNLKSKDSEADRQIPAMPNVFYTKGIYIGIWGITKFLDHSEVWSKVSLVFEDSKHKISEGVIRSRYHLRIF